MEDERLKNGARLLASRASAGGRIVLALCEDAVMPYATWWCDKDGNACGGRYFDDLPGAQRDFFAR